MGVFVYSKNIRPDDESEDEIDQVEYKEENSDSEQNIKYSVQENYV